ncbi:hypothetical protein EVAR_10498_1 [Eumeta japonica]|uniref:Uncharacterized protein n=1 Tax=Eumeta variegata TaxID=151549 RepID=A0A4C1THF3_EUMVA|nr:hypothetical protein EVAR_10498_1 [Eumeta japonica]
MERHAIGVRALHSPVALNKSATGAARCGRNKSDLVSVDSEQDVLCNYLVWRLPLIFNCTRTPAILFFVLASINNFTRLIIDGVRTRGQHPFLRDGGQTTPRK